MKSGQMDFNFDRPAPDGASGDGYARWQVERRMAMERAARSHGLPLGHRSEVLLKDGTVLRGELRLAEDHLWIEAKRDVHVLLRVDRCTFTLAEIESCVRLD